MTATAIIGRRARFLTAVAVSAYGDWLTTVAVVVSLYRLTGSVTAPAAGILLRVAPRPLGALVGGHAIDRLGAIPVLAVLGACQAGLTAALGLSVVAGSVPAVLVLLLLCQLAGAAAQPAGVTAIQSLVGAAAVGRLNAAVNLIFSSSAVIGPAIATGLLAVGSPVTLILVDAVTFLVAALLVRNLGSASTAAPRAPQHRDLSAGIRLALRHPLLRQLGAAQAGNFAVITALQAVLVAASQQRFGTPAAVGWIYTAVGVGAAAASLILLRGRVPRLGRGTLAGATMLELIPLGAFTLINAPELDVVLLGLSGFGAALYQVAGAAEVARVIDPGRLGQVNAALAFIGYAGMILGGAAAALLAQRLGWSLLLQAVWAIGALTLLAGTLSGRRSGASSDRLIVALYNPGNSRVRDYHA